MQIEAVGKQIIKTEAKLADVNRKLDAAQRDWETHEDLRTLCENIDDYRQELRDNEQYLPIER